MAFKREIIERFEGLPEDQRIPASTYKTGGTTFRTAMEAQLDAYYTTYFHFVVQLQHRGRVELCALEEEIHMRFNDPIEVGRDAMYMILDIQDVKDSEQLLREHHAQDRKLLEDTVTLEQTAKDAERFGGDWSNAMSLACSYASNCGLDRNDPALKSAMGLFALKMLEINEKREEEWLKRGRNMGKKFGLND